MKQSRLEFYATIDAGRVREYMPDVPVLLPASSWARFIDRKGRIRVPRLPGHVRVKAADSGGFVATFRNGGRYTYSPAQYVEWLSAWGPSWAATMDLCCEDEITGDRPGIVRERQEETTRLARHFWEEYRGVPWPWVPTVQGWQVDDYRRHAAELAPLLGEMRRHYGESSPWRVGVGTLCRRADVGMIRRVVRAVSEELPGYRFHLWGVKLALLQSPVPLPAQVASVDSASWTWPPGDGGNRRKGADYRDKGVSRARFEYQVLLPRYLSRVEAALSVPKQIPLWEE